ncbi:MAG: GDSL-type esterase/lipase family protein [Candidatus Wallbacteria bacterium]|nr:GDSL-type esterase/lipase family protein [Candidatus Wallbacteria bacterium]
MKTGRKFVFSTLMILLIILNLFVFGEISLRIFRPHAVLTLVQKVVYPRDSEEYNQKVSEYRVVPGNIGIMHNPDSPNFNPLGIYGKKIPVSRETGTYRILVLGDSVTDPFASCHPPYGYTFVLQDILNRKLQRRVEVLNSGVGGYNTVQEAAWLSEFGLKSQPDLILLAYVNNDTSLAENYREVSGGLEFSYYQPRKIPLLIDFGRYNRLVLESSELIPFLFISLEQLINRREIRYNFNLYEPGFDQNYAALESIYRISVENGIPLILVHFPFFHNFREYEKNDFYVRHLLTADFCAERKIPRLDLLDVYRQYAEKEVRNEEDLNKNSISSHPNQFGHQVAAEAIAEFILKNVFNKEK